MMKKNVQELSEDRLRFRAAVVSVTVSTVVMSIKFWGVNLTHSQALFSDAMESIVNVVASLLALFLVYAAAKPADKDHPYGHGKLEYFSAAFEGGLITFAAMIIIVEAIQKLWAKSLVEKIDLGLWIVLITGGVNLLLGLYLKHMARKFKSDVLFASAHHVLSDVWTSVGVLGGLGLVLLTGWWWLDGVTALCIGLFLGRTGFSLVRKSGGALMEERDHDLLAHLVDIFNRHKRPYIIQIHHVRIVRSGRFHHIDAHVVCPEFWNIADAHNRTNDFEHKVLNDYRFGGEIVFHVDPCRRAYCKKCEVEPCPIRRDPLTLREPYKLSELLDPEEPIEPKDGQEPVP